MNKTRIYELIKDKECANVIFRNYSCLKNSLEKKCLIEKLGTIMQDIEEKDNDRSNQIFTFPYSDDM
jgi:hypothetical protein